MRTLTLNFMRNCSKNKTFLSVAGGTLFCLAVGALTTACTSRDDLFGNEMIPSSQQMGSAIDSTVSVYSYVATCDSLDTNIAGFYQPFMGSYIDPVVGRTDVAVFTNFSPDGFKHTHYFGENPVIDSMRYAIAFSGALGDTAQTVTVDVYEVKEGIQFYQDSAYFSNFDMTPYIGPEPLFSFQHKGIGTAYGRLSQEFAEKLLDNTQSQENVYYADTAFHRKFPGLYFKFRDPVTSGEGQMLQFDLSQSAMFLFYHNTGPDGPDTLQQRMWFFGDLTYDYVSFSTVKHDYSFADPARGGVTTAEIGDTLVPSKYIYVQGLAGLMGALKVDEDGLDALKRKATDLGYTHIALHRAELQVTMVDSGVEQYDLSFPTLGIYYNMLKYEFLSEYNPLLAAITNSGYTPTLGGSLSRSRGVYTFDITSYVQRLLTGKESRFTTQLLPDFNYRNFFFRSWIYGTDSPYPPQLVLTYTMIK